MSTVTAIIPTFNRASLLRECIESVISQTRRVDQILVVDDGSTDGTADMVSACYGNKVEYWWKPNGGKSSALNFGLQYAKSSYIWICDDDDVARPDGCALLRNALDSNPDAAFAFGRFKLMEIIEASIETREPFPWPKHFSSNLFLTLMDQMVICQFSSMVRAEVYRKLAPFREDLLRSQDYEMILRIAHQYRGTFVDEVIFCQRQHTGTRGPVHDRFTAADKIRKWVQYDKIFFMEWRNSLDLEAYVPPFVAAEPDLQLRYRAALIQRAVIFARRALVNEALADMESASKMGGAEAPSYDELALMQRAFIEDWSISALIEDHQNVKRLRSSGRTRFGRYLLGSVISVLLWKARAFLVNGRFGEALTCLFMAARISV